MSDPFIAPASALFQRIDWARAAGDERAAAVALEELLDLYVRLGKREVGDVSEQNDYIVARHLGFVPEALQDLGVSAADLPEPPGRRRALPPPPAPDPEVARADIAERFARLGRTDPPPERFGVAFRPQDNVVRQEVLQPYAVVDTHDNGLPVAWFDTSDWAEVVADTANRLRLPG
ncbi:hypothetical protein ACIBAC_00485 [Streptomyces sp. NPDC051362]|uniref:hypothetical protein n=1 Tax=Streptomyces sp. NPDC051362 TaxID=3365651 RepID=UPI0037AB6CD0